MAASAFIIAILAGGAATRLGGRDKGLQVLDGRPLIAWVVEAVAKMDAPKPLRAREGVSRDKSIVVEAAPATNEYADALIVANRHLDEYARYAPVICDIVSGFRGPLAGIAAALAKCPTPWLLTVPVDSPDPPHDLARRLSQATHEDDASALVAHDGERRQPLFALYRRELAQSAMVAIGAGQGVQQWQESISAREVDFSDRRQQFQNLNTPEDFTAYAEQHRFAG